MSMSKLAGISAVAATLLGCGSEPGEVIEPSLERPFNHSYVALRPENFQKIVDGKQCDLYTLENAAGSFVRLSNFGAKIVQFVVPDRSGEFGDVVLGYDGIDALMSGQASMGAFMGRYANRIAGGKFSLDGTQYQLALNDGTRPNSVHGGVKGARLRVFDAVQLSRQSVHMSYRFADGEEGFPGTLVLSVVYSLHEGNALHIEYAATAIDKKTVFNLTSHPFFNLSNQPGSSIVDHVLTIDADRVLEIDKNLIPTGVLRDVTGTPMDFRSGKSIGRDLMASYDLLMFGGGYDHTFVLNKSADGRLARAAAVYDPTSGRELTVFSTEPGLQFFSGNGFAAQAPRDAGKGGVLYPLRSGFALEPMHYPDAPNQPTFPSTELRPGETYRGEIVFQIKPRSTPPI